MENQINEIIFGVVKDTNDKIELSQIQAHTKLRDDLGLDSFNLAELTVHLEEVFGVDVFESGVVSTVGEIYQKIIINK